MMEAEDTNYTVHAYLGTEPSIGTLVNYLVDEDGNYLVNQDGAYLIFYSQGYGMAINAPDTNYTVHAED